MTQLDVVRLVNREVQVEYRFHGVDGQILVGLSEGDPLPPARV